MKDILVAFTLTKHAALIDNPTGATTTTPAANASTVDDANGSNSLLKSI